MGERAVRNERENWVPMRKFAFPAGVCGAEIRITVPASASKEDLEMTAHALMAVAEKWRGIAEA